MHHREDFHLSAHKLTGLFPICLNLSAVGLQRLLSHPNSDDKATVFVLCGGAAAPEVDSQRCLRQFQDSKSSHEIQAPLTFLLPGSGGPRTSPPAVSGCDSTIIHVNPSVRVSLIS